MEMLCNAQEKFLKEIDNFADDAVGRRLGNGAKFYGKRKSAFYGEEDQLRKEDPDKANPEEDFAGAPAGASYFVLSKERDEQGRPLRLMTRQEARAEKAKEEAESEDMLSSFRKEVADDDEESILARERFEEQARFEDGGSAS